MVSITLKPVMPKGVLSGEGVRRNIEALMRVKSGPEVRTLFKQTVDGWKLIPTFTIKTVNTKRELLTQIWPYGDNEAANKYRLVVLGSPRHTIKPVRAKLLRFRTGYRAATRPRVIGSSRAIRSGPWVGLALVNHPGFEGRAFDEAIAEVYEPIFQDDVKKAVSKSEIWV